MASGASTGGLVLAIDTSGERCSAAILDVASGTILSRADPLIGRGHAEQLMGILAEVLSEASLSYADIARIAVGVGPGSFTGIRVGVSAARGLSLALGVRCVGVDALSALAEPHLQLGLPVLAVQDARRGEIYAALFEPDGTCIRGPAAIPANGVATYVPAGSGPLTIVGSAGSMALDQIGSTHRTTIADPSGLVDIAAVARIGASLPADRVARPLYLRSADAKPQAPSRLFAPADRSQSGAILR